MMSAKRKVKQRSLDQRCRDVVSDGTGILFHILVTTSFAKRNEEKAQLRGG